jgi:hypothetical protein
MVFVAMGVAMYAVYQYITESDRVWHLVSPYKERGKGTYINPNHLAGFLEMVLPLGLAFMLTSRLKPAAKVLVGYASLVMVAGIGVSLSRGSWIACAVALLLFFFVLMLQRQFWLQGILVLAVLGCAGGLFVKDNFVVKKRFDQMVIGGKPSDNRLELWKPAYRMWQENFWFGVGPDHYDVRFRAYRPQIVQTQPDHAHNDYLNTLADWGVTGASLVACAIGLVLAGVFKTWRTLRSSMADLGSGRSNKFAVVLGATIGMVAALVHAFVEFNMQIPANAILFVALLGMASGHLRFGTGGYRFGFSAITKVLVTLGLVAVLSFLGFQEWKRGREHVWLKRAEGEPQYSETQMDYLKRAFNIEPANYRTAHWIGECYRAHSLEGFEDYVELGDKAISWFETGQRLNPYYGDLYLHQAMCLDWLERFDESKPLYIKALECDPNGSFTIAMTGWHYLQMGKYAAARPWFQRSKALLWQESDVADGYLGIIEMRLEDQAGEKDNLLRISRKY